MNKLTFTFPTDFDSQKPQLVHIGRIYLGEGSIIRLVFTPEGLKASISMRREAKDVLIQYDEDELIGVE